MKQKLETIINEIKSYDYHTLSYPLIIYCVALSVIGILAIHSATNGSIQYVTKQIIGLVAGLIAMTFMMLVR